MAEEIYEEDPLDEKAYTSLLGDLRKLSGNRRIGREKVVRVSSESCIPPVDKTSILRKIGDAKLSKDSFKSKTLIEPLEKPAAKRLKRAAGFENVAVDANKWEGIVDKRRKADQLTFPLEDVDLRVVTTRKNFQPRMRTNLEKEVYTLLHGAKLTTGQRETEEEIQIKKALSLQEIKLKSKEIWRARLLRERLERKSALLNKSKSRKYHKILRREKLRKQKEEFENLKHSNPVAALELLNELEKVRVEERMSLKHKTSKWLHTKKLRAKHDKKASTGLQENDEMRRELLEKLNKADAANDDRDLQDHDEELMTSDDDGENNNNSDRHNPYKSYNELRKLEENDDGGFGKMKNFWEEFNKRKITELQAQRVAEEEALKQNELEKQLQMDGNIGKNICGKDFDATLVEEENISIKGNKKGNKRLPKSEASKAPEKLQTLKGDLIEDSQQIPDAVQGKNGVKSTHTKKIPKKKSIIKSPNEDTEATKKSKKKSTKKKLPNETKVLSDAESRKKPKCIINSTQEQGKPVTTPKKKNQKKAVAEVGDCSNSSIKKLNQLKKKQKKRSKTEMESGIEDIKEINESDIDELFERANIKASKIVSKKLKKTKMEIKKMESKTKEKMLKTDSKKPQREDKGKGVEMEFDFTAKNDADIIEEYLDRVKTYEDLDSLKTNSVKPNIAHQPNVEVKDDISKEATPVQPHLEPENVMLMQVKARKEDSDFMQVQKRLNGDSDDEEAPIENFEFLFEDDTNLAEFRAKKKEMTEKEKPKDTDIYMKGWGSWAGPGITVSKRKRKQFRIKATKSSSRNQYHSCGSVIYNENHDVHENIRKKMVNQIPYPFASVKDFEASIRQPIGRMFVPEAAHEKLIAPQVVSKMGAIINPMGEEALLKNHEAGKKSQLEKNINEKLKLKKSNRKTYARKYKQSSYKKLVIH